MTGWTADELARIGRADELGIASRRPDGSLRPQLRRALVTLRHSPARDPRQAPLLKTLYDPDNHVVSAHAIAAR